MIWLDWTLAAIFLLLGLWLAIMNAVILFLRFTRGRTSSIAPLAGGLFGALGIALLPVSWHFRWFWVPLIVDVGCVPALALAVVEYLRRTKVRAV